MAVGRGQRASGVVVVLATAMLAAPLARTSAQDLDDARAVTIAHAVITDERLCDAIWFRPAPNQGPHVLASVDFSGRDFCNEIYLIQADGRRPAIIDSIRGWLVGPLRDVVSDLDADGLAELIVPTGFTDYEGAFCMAIVPVVHRCTSAGCDAVTGSTFAGFYAGEAARIGRLVMKEPQQSRPCREAERDKLRRLSGREPAAGFTLAEAWMKSSDASLRRKALAVFADIANADSRARLQTLANDRDPLTANFARRALAQP